MKRSTKEKLIANSNAVYHKLVKKDDLGMGELTTAGIVVSLMVLLGIFIGSAVMLGGF